MCIVSVSLTKILIRKCISIDHSEKMSLCVTLICGESGFEQAEHFDWIFTVVSDTAELSLKKMCFSAS